MPIILALVALVIVATLGFSISEPKLEKLVTVTGDKLINDPLEKVLNPGVLILAVIAIVVITGAASK